MIHNSDSLEGIRGLPDESVDLILTDPPYGCTRAPWDVRIDTAAYWEQWARIAKPQAGILVFCDLKFAVSLYDSAQNFVPFRFDLIWEKSTPAGFLNAGRFPLRAHELILAFGKRPPKYNIVKDAGKKYTRKNKRRKQVPLYNKFNVFGGQTDFEGRYPRSVLHYANPRVPGQHPTAKPDALCDKLILMYSDPGDLVVDCFAGGGSIPAAAVRNGRRYEAWETDKAYYKAAEKKIFEAYEKSIDYVAGKG